MLSQISDDARIRKINAEQSTLHKAQVSDARLTSYHDPAQRTGIGRSAERHHVVMCCPVRPPVQYCTYGYSAVCRPIQRKEWNKEARETTLLSHTLLGNAPT